MPEASSSFITRSRKALSAFIKDNQGAIALREEAVAMGYVQIDPETGLVVRDGDGKVVSAMYETDFAGMEMNRDTFLEGVAAALDTLNSVPAPIVQAMYKARLPE